MKNKINVAIDGYSSCGKSTLAKSLAKQLGYLYIDSGAMYRAVTLFAMNSNLIRKEEVDIERLLENLNKIHIDFILANGQNSTRLNGEIVEKEIRSMEVSNFVSQVSKIPEVRTMLRELQQSFAKKGGVVMDGRDIGSAVLPDAELKVFMTASPEIRAQRRFAELQSKGEETTIEEVSKNLSHRDLLDSTRETNPLIQVPDARVLDNSHLDQKEQLDLVLKWVEDVKMSMSQ